MCDNDDEDGNEEKQDDTMKKKMMMTYDAGDDDDDDGDEEEEDGDDDGDEDDDDGDDDDHHDAYLHICLWHPVAIVLIWIYIFQRKIKPAWVVIKSLDRCLVFVLWVGLPNLYNINIYFIYEGKYHNPGPSALNAKWESKQSS